MDVAVCTDNPLIDEDMTLFGDCLHRDDEMISERLRVLAAQLKELGY